MYKSAKKGISVLLATTVLTTPFTLVPKAAYAISVEDVSADDTGADEETEYTIEFEIEKDLRSGDEIYIKFPSGYSVDKKLKKSDVSIENDDGDDVSVKTTSASSSTVTIEVGEKIKKGTVLTVVVDKITNPDSKGDYSIKVTTSAESSGDSQKITIGKSSSSNSSNSSSGKIDVSQSSTEAEATISLTIDKFTLASKGKLKKGKYIYVEFPTKDMLPKSIDRSDVKVNGVKAEKISISSGDTLRIEVPSGADGDSYIKLDISSSAGIKNPSETGKNYTYTVEYDSKKYKSSSFEVKDSARTPFDVSLSERTAGARAAYTFDVNLSSKLYANTDITVEFPSADMIPPVLSGYTVTVNGSQVSSLSVSGSKVSFRTPSGFSNTDRATIKFTHDAYISNPKTPGSYAVTVKVDNKSYRSKSFEITGAVAPIPVDNSSATLSLTKATASTPTGLQIGIRGLGLPITRGQGFIELVIPAGFRIPAYVPSTAVTVNGVAAAYVGVRGQNLIVVPSQDILAQTAVQLNVLESAGIVNPATPGVYSISVYTSEEKGLLFARPATIAALNGVSFKANVASFTKAGKAVALAAAPYTVNGNTLMPATFFRDALGFSVTYTKSTAKIVSGKTVMQFTVGSNVATVNGQKVTLPAAVQLKNNVPCVPLRTVTDRTGYKVVYVNDNYTVYK